MRRAGLAKIVAFLALTAFTDQIVVNFANVAIIQAAEKTMGYVIVNQVIWEPDVKMVSIL